MRYSSFSLLHAKDSPVYTPKDKDLWMLAKLSVQGADLGYNQVAEHLAKTHLLMEPFCVSKDRQLSERHPLHQIIKYHCRGISITDKLAFKILLAEYGSLHNLFPYGYRGAVSIALKQFRLTSWKDTDFLNNIRVMCNLLLLFYFCSGVSDTLWEGRELEKSSWSRKEKDKTGRKWAKQLQQFCKRKRKNRALRNQLGKERNILGINSDWSSLKTPHTLLYRLGITKRYSFADAIWHTNVLKTGRHSLASF